MRKPQAPLLTGIITDAGTPALFRVDAVEVACSPTTATLAMTGGRGASFTGCRPHALRQSLKVYGERRKHTKVVDASELELATPEKHDVAGLAIIDQKPAIAGSEWVVRADGYRLLIPSSAQRQFKAPLHGMEDMSANVWVRYSGKQRADGVVVVQTAEFSRNEVTRLEEKMQARREFDPATPTESDRQGRWSEALPGLDPKRFPAYHDAAMQSRVEALAHGWCLPTSGTAGD